ncbi:phage Gp37/Gp68 family protein [Comamonas sp. w2-DMI]|uniref:phage Gp37/Gp68 family protein n=1 Tax=Comamonas sp. w2-DMI TaxID=3126391 RepID=UPI0032E4CE9B
MAENTKIEWTDHTFNPWEGCQKVGPGCDHCYAETRNVRYAGGQAINWGPGAPRRRTSAANWRKPLAWSANHDAFFAQHGRRQRVFCASLADVFDNAVDPQWRVDLFRLIKATPNLDWLLLTKRIGAVPKLLDESIRHIESLPDWAGEEPHPLETVRNMLADWVLLRKPPQNIWIGATVVTQEEADRDIPKLLAVPARVRFLSMEPLLGPVDLRLQRPAREDDRQDMDGYCSYITTAAGAGIHWVIAGGESGPGARPMHPDWARSLRDQCHAAGVPFLFKQWGEWHTAAYHASTGRPVFRQFDSHQQWVNKASTWVQGGICLDRHGRELKNGGDMARARDQGDFPVTIMHRVGKKAAGRLLDGRTWDGFPAP